MESHDPTYYVVEILKWVGIVFAAGFVGYFGKHLSKALIAKTQRRSSTRSTDLPHAVPSDGDKDAHKAEKKRLKAEQKCEKKLGK
jgi:hypothetical protein